MFELCFFALCSPKLHLQHLLYIKPERPAVHKQAQPQLAIAFVIAIVFTLHVDWKKPHLSITLIVL